MTAAEIIKILFLLDSMTAQALETAQLYKTQMTEQDEQKLKQFLTENRPKTDALYAEVLAKLTPTEG